MCFYTGSDELRAQSPPLPRAIRHAWRGRAAETGGHTGKIGWPSKVPIRLRFEGRHRPTLTSPIVDLDQRPQSV